MTFQFSIFIFLSPRLNRISWTIFGRLDYYNFVLKSICIYIGAVTQDAIMKYTFGNKYDGINCGLNSNLLFNSNYY